MAFDVDLADRLRAMLANTPNLTEMAMFGGLAFLINGNMAVAASSEGGLMVRVDPEESDGILASTKAQSISMRGRLMKGWLRVESDDLLTEQQLEKWIDLGRSFATSLPAK